jgi:hypothetical protein
MANELKKNDLHTLVGLVAERCPFVPEAARADVVNEAFALVLRTTPAAGPGKLLESVAERIPEVAERLRVKERRERRSRASAVLGPNPTVEAHRERRGNRRPHRPNGAVAAQVTSGAPRFIVKDEGALPEMDVRIAARRLRKEVLEPAERGHPVSAAAANFIRKAHQRHFGDAATVWASILAEQIGSAKREKLDWDAFLANGKRVEPAREDLATIQRKDETSPPEQVPLKMDLVYRDKKTTLLAIRKQGEEDILAWLRGKTEPVGLQPVPYDSTRASQEVLGNTVHELLETYRGYVVLPDYVFDHELLAWLIDRAGTQGGGGPNGTISEATIATFLINPKKLVAEIRAYGARRADRAGEAEAGVLEKRFAAMADRVEQLARK